jgi:propionate CoA-transferase
MDLLTRSSLLAQLGAWRASWALRQTRFGPRVEGNPRFMSARDAADLVPDGAVVMTSGLGGNALPSLLYAGLREAFEETGHPRDLTLVATGGTGARGLAPGTLEDVAVEGLCTRFIAGHLETYRAVLALADAGALELQCLPQGTLALLVEAQGRGERSLASRVGVGTFMDPRRGRGTPVIDPRAPQLVTVDGDQLRYRLPPVDVALFNLPAADRDGNLYARNAAVIAEAREAARAARRNGGVVIANVGLLVEPGRDEVFLAAGEVDAIVLHPATEQTLSVPHRHHWPVLVPGAAAAAAEDGLARLQFMSWVMGATPRRSEVDGGVARLAAWVLARHGHPGMSVNVGVGLPEEVCRVLHEAGLASQLELFTEGGVVGGVPAPGPFFGAAVCPTAVLSSAEVFRRCRAGLDATVLGFVQVDGAGDVNASRRGPGAAGYVGPGGSMDLAAAASTIVFVGSWLAHGRARVRRGELVLGRGGAPKLVEAVDEVTFSAAEALRAGKRVFYCTTAGAFQLTRRGLELLCLMPGIDLRRDLLDRTRAPIVLPASGEVPVVDRAVLTGAGFRLGFG